MEDKKIGQVSGNEAGPFLTWRMATRSAVCNGRNPPHVDDVQSQFVAFSVTPGEADFPYDRCLLKERQVAIRTSISKLLRPSFFAISQNRFQFPPCLQHGSKQLVGKPESKTVDFGQLSEWGRQYGRRFWLLIFACHHLVTT